MRLFRRPARLPESVRGRLPLGPRERIVVGVPTSAGWAVVGTRSLHVVPDDGDVTSRPWHEVDSARLDPEAHVFTLAWVDGTTTDLDLPDDDERLAREVKGRVQASVVHHERVELGRESVRVALRRDAEGHLFTQVIGPPSVDLTDPATAAVIDAAEARVRDAAGLR